MYLRELWVSCRRRWWLLLALVIVTEGILLAASPSIKTTYDAQASVVLIPPRSTEVPDLNRLLDLGSLDDSVEVLARSMRSAETLETLEAAAPGAEFEVSPDYSTSAPILLLNASGADQDATATMLEELLDLAPANLEQLQTELDIPVQSRITSVVVSQDPAPVPDVKGRLRMLGVIGLALVGLSAVLVAAVDGFLLRRSVGRGSGDRSGSPAAPAAKPTPAPPTNGQRVPRGTDKPSKPRKPRPPGPPREPRPEVPSSPDPRTATGWPQVPELVKPVGGHGRSG